MVYKEHLIELWVNGDKVELEDQDSINIKLNNVLYDPTKISNKQAEYSFEFEIPCTAKNNKIFDYANSLSKPNKFHNRYTAAVYADGTSIFNGTITITSIKDGMYKVNLVSVKVYSLSDIFGEDKLTDIPWYVPFDGVDSINEYNADSDSKVTFPLTSYGAFQKKATYKDAAGSDYTSKYDLDKYNLWYMESFPPSLNALETVKKAFEGKGYTVIGDAFSDEFLKNIFMSTNLADNQDPDYNLGNPKMGHIHIQTSWLAPQDTPTTGFTPAVVYGTTQELKFPYMKSGDNYYDCANGCVLVEPDYNFKEIRLYDMLLASEGGTVYITGDTYMYQPNEHLIVIPSDGFYRIDMTVYGQLNQINDITATQLVHEQFSDFDVMGNGVVEKDITFHPDFKITTPLEVQLVRNYKPLEGGIELIKGKNNFRCHDGYPDNETELNFGKTPNWSSWTTCFPHEKKGVWWINPFPTKWEDLSSSVYGAIENDSAIGYVYYDGELMCYDPAVSDKFICGVTSMGNKVGGGCAAVRKNGYSWSKMYSEKQEAMYQQEGYEIGEIVDYTIGEYNWMRSNRNKNVYPQSMNSFTQGTNRMTGRIQCLMYLKKNDYLNLFAVHRNYDNSLGTVSYSSSANVELDITAASPNTMASLLAKGYGFNSPSEFDTDLKVTNFLNKETKVADWIQHVIDAFNLELTQDGKVISINTCKKNNSVISTVNIDDRANTYDAESEMIDYPRTMSVKYKINTDEHGFYTTVPEDKLNRDDWKNYGDSGFTIITLNDDSYVTKDSTKSLQFSYTWYDNFDWYPVDSAFTQDTGATPTVLRIPVISKEEYMIDGYDYTESMNHKGYNLPQRFWYRPTATDCYVWTRTFPAEEVNIYTTSNQYNGLNLSYKVTENSILKKYFNIEADLSSNYVTVEVYLTPEEYKRLKDGAYVRFDKDTYKVVEIQGYDPTCYSTTELKMMKL